MLQQRVEKSALFTICSVFLPRVCVWGGGVKHRNIQTHTTLCEKSHYSKNIPPAVRVRPSKVVVVLSLFWEKKDQKCFFGRFCTKLMLKTFFLTKSLKFWHFPKKHGLACIILFFFVKKKKHVEKKNIIICLQSLFNVVQAFKFIQTAEQNFKTSAKFINMLAEAFCVLHGSKWTSIFC